MKTETFSAFVVAFDGGVARLALTQGGVVLELVQDEMTPFSEATFWAAARAPVRLLPCWL